MSTIVIFVEELFFVVLGVFLEEVIHTFRIAVTAHVSTEVAIGTLVCLIIGDKSPRKDRILRDVVVIPTCYLIEPLQVLIIRHTLIDPKQGLI